MRIIIPLGSKVTEVIRTNGSVYVNVVLKDGTPKTVKQP